MKNAIQTIISLIRANPKYACAALALDATLGTIVAVLVFVGLNATITELTSTLVLSFTVAIALVAVGALGYTVLYNTGYSFELEEDEE